MSRKELIIYEDLTDIDPSPTPDEDMLSALPQVAPKEEDAPRLLILGSLTGPIINRHSKTIKHLFPNLTFPPYPTQTRFVIIYNEGDPYPKIKPWSLEIHGEFDDIPCFPLEPAQLERHLKQFGIHDEVITFLTFEQVRNARKNKASVRIHPSRS